VKWLSIVDEHTRKCLAHQADRTITSEDVVDTLAELFAMRGVPKCICSDNGPEFISKAIQSWLEKLQTETLYVACFVERLLDCTLFGLTPQCVGEDVHGSFDEQSVFGS